ncbi:MAG: lipocalin family protein [Rikenellaceae bacterium]|nr:lipocalin family protein [Rikenellaceae bacterium]
MATKAIFKSACGLMAAVVFTACGGNGIEGKWVEPVPGMKDQMQGVNLEKGGKASSINMATLQYEKWERRGEKLILSGKSIGNGETISFSDTLAIEKLTENELTLKKGSLTINYRKQ